MARCKGEALLSKIGVNKLNKTMEVDFAVLTDLDNCIKANAKNYAGIINADSSVFYQYRTPPDMFNCLAVGCRNGGTLMVTGDSARQMRVKYFLAYDATEIVAGVATMYYYFPAAGTYHVGITLSDAADEMMRDSDYYEQSVIISAEGFHPVVFDFSKVPSLVSGNGWQATASGAYFMVGLRPAAQVAGAPITWGISSFYFYNSISEFEVNDVVKIACLSEITGDITVDAVDASCWGAGYDPDSISIEKTITGGSVTPNYWKLNPLVDKGQKTEGWFIQNTTKEILGPVVVNNITYGYIQLADMNMDECAFTTAALSDSCNVTDSHLSRVSSPVAVELNENQFIVQDGKASAATDAGRILFHESRIGLSTVVSYPKGAAVEHFVASDENLIYRRTRMTYTETQTDGVKIVYVFNNVLVTSFPATINADETTFGFTISIQRDRSGYFFERYRILD